MVYKSFGLKTLFNLRQISPFSKKNLFKGFSLATSLYILHNLNQKKLILNKNANQFQNVYDSDIFRPDESSDYFIRTADESSLKLISGSANRELASEVAAHLDVQLARVLFSHNSNEVKIRILDSVRGQNVFIIQPLCPPVNDNIMELLLLISDLKRSNANKITVIMPYMAYSRQYSLKGKRCNLAAKDIISMLEQAGVDQFVTINLHNPDIKGFFNVPFLNLDIQKLAVPYLQKKQLNDLLVVSSVPKKHGITRALNMIGHLNDFNIKGELGVLLSEYMRKEQLDEKTKKSLKMNFIGPNPKNRDILIVDSLLQTGETLSNSVEHLKKLGAKRIYAFCPHTLLNEEGYELVEQCRIDEIITTNSIPDIGIHSDKIRYISVGKVLAEVISRLHQKKTLAEFREDNDFNVDQQIQTY